MQKVGGISEGAVMFFAASSSAPTFCMLRVIKSETGGENEKALCSRRLSAAVLPWRSMKLRPNAAGAAVAWGWAVVVAFAARRSGAAAFAADSVAVASAARQLAAAFVVAGSARPRSAPVP